MALMEKNTGFTQRRDVESVLGMRFTHAKK
jgi:hypothetical protein